MLAEIRSGFTVLADGTVAPARASRIGSTIVGDGQGKYYEQASRGNIFSLVLTATTTNISAGNLLGAAAAASTQFAVWNPAGSGKNLSLLKFAMQITSGTTPIAGMWHGLASTAPSIATTVVSAIMCNNAGMAAASVARAATHATGTALTGGSAPLPLRSADFTATAGTYANLAGRACIENIDGDIVLPPGTMWVPLWAAQGTTMLVCYSLTWEEIPV